MSKREPKFEETSAGRWALRKRRIALGTYLLFLAGCLVGTQGPWWMVHIGDKPFWETPKRGPDYMRWRIVKPVDEDAQGMEKYVYEREERVFRPATIAVLALVIAFLVAFYDLIADASVMWPVFLATLVVCGVAGFVLYDMDRIVKEFQTVLEMRRYLGGGKAKSPPQGAVALKTHWGLALFVSSALVMLVNSLYLTFIAPRAGKPKTS